MLSYAAFIAITCKPAGVIRPMLHALRWLDALDAMVSMRIAAVPACKADALMSVAMMVA